MLQIIDLADGLGIEFAFPTRKLLIETSPEAGLPRLNPVPIARSGDLSLTRARQFGRRCAVPKAKFK